MEQSKHRLTRIGGLAGVMGAILLLVTVGFHPLEADPGDIRAVFREIGADAVWTTIRLDQFVGYLLVFTFFVALHDLIVTTPARWHVRLGVGIGAASLAAAAVSQAVEGIALKSLVEAWLAVPPAEKNAAFALHQVGIGMAAVTAILIGATAGVYGRGVGVSGRFPRSFGWLGLIAGIGTMLGGPLTAYDAASFLAMPFNLALIIFIGLAGWHMLRTREKI